MQPQPEPGETPLETLARERDRLRLANEELTRRVRIAEELAAQRGREARDTAAEAQQFAYAASHDMQEPLRSVTSYAQLLERSVPADSEAAEFARYVVEGTARMNSLMRDLLSYSRLSRSPRLVAVSLAAVAQGAALFLHPELQKAGATLAIEDLPEVSGDERQLNQLFAELLRNAVKFRAQRPLTVRVAYQEAEGCYVISVSDNGQGIEPKYHEQVFEVFKRLHGRDVPGTGIGLSLCRKIVKAHGGRIWVESDGSSGSTVRFTLPL